MTSVEPLPQALPAEPRGRGIYLLPMLALILVVGYLLIPRLLGGGAVITVSFRQGHGLKVGDAVTFRGLIIGEVTAIRLLSGLEEISVQADLTADGSALAREGSRFWIVRPHASLYGLQGMDTVLGARYLAALPGNASSVPAVSFTGVDEQWVSEAPEDEDEFILEAPTCSKVRLGMPVKYRQFKIGAVRRISPKSLANGFDVAVGIDRKFRQLVRSNTRFWIGGGILFEGTWRGFKLDVDDLQSMLIGGIMLAVPDQNGSLAHPGSHYPLDPSSPDGVSAWNPTIKLD